MSIQSDNKRTFQSEREVFISTHNFIQDNLKTHNIVSDETSAAQKFNFSDKIPLNTGTFQSVHNDAIITHKRSSSRFDSEESLGILTDSLLDNDTFDLKSLRPLDYDLDKTSLKISDPITSEENNDTTTGESLNMKMNYLNCSTPKENVAMDHCGVATDGIDFQNNRFDQKTSSPLLSSTLKSSTLENLFQANERTQSSRNILSSLTEILSPILEESNLTRIIHNSDETYIMGIETSLTKTFIKNELSSAECITPLKADVELNSVKTLSNNLDTLSKTYDNNLNCTYIFDDFHKVMTKKNTLENTFVVGNNSTKEDASTFEKVKVFSESNCIDEKDENVGDLPLLETDYPEDKLNDVFFDTVDLHSNKSTNRILNKTFDSVCDTNNKTFLKIPKISAKQLPKYVANVPQVKYKAKINKKSFNINSTFCKKDGISEAFDKTANNTVKNNKRLGFESKFTKATVLKNTSTQRRHSIDSYNLKVQVSSSSVGCQRKPAFFLGSHNSSYVVSASKKRVSSVSDVSKCSAKQLPSKSSTDLKCQDSKLSSAPAENRRISLGSDCISADCGKEFKVPGAEVNLCKQLGTSLKASNKKFSNVGNRSSFHGSFDSASEIPIRNSSLKTLKQKSVENLAGISSHVPLIKGSELKTCSSDHSFSYKRSKSFQTKSDTQSFQSKCVSENESSQLPMRNSFTDTSKLPESNKKNTLFRKPVRIEATPSKELDNKSNNSDCMEMQLGSVSNTIDKSDSVMKVCTEVTNAEVKEVSFETSSLTNTLVNKSESLNTEAYILKNKPLNTSENGSVVQVKIDNLQKQQNFAERMESSKNLSRNKSNIQEKGIQGIKKNSQSKKKLLPLPQDYRKSTNVLKNELGMPSNGNVSKVTDSQSKKKLLPLPQDCRKSTSVLKNELDSQSKGKSLGQPTGYKKFSMGMLTPNQLNIPSNADVTKVTGSRGDSSKLPMRKLRSPKYFAVKS